MEHILIPIDFSPESPAMLNVAAGEARLRNASVTLLHIIETITAQPMELVPTVIPDDDSIRETEAREKLQQLAEKFFPNIECTIKIHRGFGPISSEIASFQSEEAVSLIVISSHARTMFERLFLENTSSKVIDSARCPVLVVPV